MNIFIFDYNPKRSAQQHCNRHCVKMIVEQVQILCTAHRVLDGSDNPMLYKLTHQNHPSAIWVRSSLANYRWVYNQTKALCKEYTFRYGKVHKAEAEGLLALLSTPPKNINKTTKLYRNTFVKVVEPDCDIGDAVASYREYFNKHKQHIADWKKREAPDWYKKDSSSTQL